ncbi:LysR family transcriptional regulator, partial [Shewanella sp. GutDb-MelDb]|uniref:LysR family transcriptional regulator n=1 Tax=Shewanella sp. GutDb-MelDb TaxID=2058316 RepID=UPI000CB54824
MEVDYNKLRLLIELSKYGNLKDASIKMSRSVSSLSKDLAALRLQLNDALLVRVSGKLQMTSFLENIHSELDNGFKKIDE